MSTADTSHEILRRQIQAILAESDKARVGDDPFWAIAAAGASGPAPHHAEAAEPEDRRASEPEPCTPGALRAARSPTS